MTKKPKFTQKYVPAVIAITAGAARPIVASLSNAEILHTAEKNALNGTYIATMVCAQAVLSKWVRTRILPRPAIAACV